VGLESGLPGNYRTNHHVSIEEATMPRYYRRRRTGTRRRYGYRRGRSGIDPLFWVALGVAVLIAVFALAR
jgi:hypothetical protein